MRYILTDKFVTTSAGNVFKMKALIGYYLLFDQRFQTDRRSLAAYVRIDSLLKADEKQGAPFYPLMQEDWEILVQAVDKPQPMVNAQTGERYPAYPWSPAAELIPMLDAITGALDVEPAPAKAAAPEPGAKITSAKTPKSGNGAAARA